MKLIHKNNKTYCKDNTVMLPTKDKSLIIINTYINDSPSIPPMLSIQAAKQYLASALSHKDASALIERGLQPQHLYITSDEEIKKDRIWCLNTYNTPNTVMQVNVGGKDWEENKKAFKKIIATTDKLIRVVEGAKGEVIEEFVPQIQQSFVELFVKEGEVDEVLVELEKVCMVCGNSTIKHNYRHSIKNYFYKLLVNQDNTVNIELVKKITYTKKDLPQIIADCIYSLNEYNSGINIELFPGGTINRVTGIEDWVKQNL